MTAPATTVTIDLPTATAVTSDTVTATITRGRTSAAFDGIDPADVEVLIQDEVRDYDPLNGSSPYAGELVPGRAIVIASGGVTIFTGTVADYQFEYDAPGVSIPITRVAAEDDLASLARAEFDEWTTTFGDLPGDRITAVLARPEVDYGGSTSIDDGVTWLADDLVTWGSNVLNYVSLIVQTDMGVFFVDRSGVLTYKDRHAFINSTSAATFGTAGIPFHAIRPSYGRDQLINRWQLKRSAPVLEDAPEPEVITVSDSTSITAYKRTLSRSIDGLLLQDDTQVLDLATQLLSIYKDPIYRFESITVKVHALDSGDQTTVLGLDIGSVVTVVWTPNDVGSSETRTCVVEGIQHVIAPSIHEMTFTLNDSSILQTGNYWTPGDATYGEIGSAGGDSTDYPIAF